MNQNVIFWLGGGGKAQRLKEKWGQEFKAKCKLDLMWPIFVFLKKIKFVGFVWSGRNRCLHVCHVRTTKPTPSRFSIVQSHAHESGEPENEKKKKTIR